MVERGVSSEFLGYEGGEGVGTVQALVRGGREVKRLAAGEQGEVVLDRTPLYAEAGGQVGERGRLSWAGGLGEMGDSTSPAPGLIAHRILVKKGSLSVGEEVEVRSFPEERVATRRNHTATHLLHAALKAVLGPHVKQSGSLVAPDRLRFDFTHYRPLSAARIQEIEDLVNARILRNQIVETRLLPLDEALATGAVALFGEKYDAKVRVVSIPDFSTELCGGLHCSGTGDIGVFKIVAEKGISAGVRRLDALTGFGALQRFQDDEEKLAELAGHLGVPREEVGAAARRNLQRQKDLQKEVERLRLKLAGKRSAVGDDQTDVVSIDGMRVLARRIEDLDRSQMRNLADQLKRSAEVVVLGSTRKDRVSLLVAVRDEAAHRVPAKDVVMELAKVFGGEGGGKATLAEAGGRDPAKLDEALDRGPEVVRAILARGGGT